MAVSSGDLSPRFRQRSGADRRVQFRGEGPPVTDKIGMVGRSVQPGTAALGISLESLGAKKSSSGKVQLAALLKSATSVSNGWLAERLEMGQPASVSQFVRGFRLEALASGVGVNAGGVSHREQQAHSPRGHGRRTRTLVNAADGIGKLGKRKTGKSGKRNWESGDAVVSVRIRVCGEARERRPVGGATVG